MVHLQHFHFRDDAVLPLRVFDSLSLALCLQNVVVSPGHRGQGYMRYICPCMFTMISDFVFFSMVSVSIRARLT